MLKTLREKKNISRVQLSKLTRLSPYQVEGLEGKGVQNVLSKLFLCVKALGYKAEDIFHLLEHDPHLEEIKIPRGVFGKPLSETHFEEGIKLSTLLQDRGIHIGLLDIATGKRLSRGLYPAGDLVFGVVREGTLIIDLLLKQAAYPKDHFFVLPGSRPVEFLSGDNCVRVSALLFSIQFPR